MAEVKAPVLTGEIITPRITPGACKDIKQYKAKPELREKVNFLPEKPSNWKETFIKNCPASLTAGGTIP